MFSKVWNINYQYKEKLYLIFLLPSKLNQETSNFCKTHRPLRMHDKPSWWHVVLNTSSASLSALWGLHPFCATCEHQEGRRQLCRWCRPSAKDPSGYQPLCSFLIQQIMIFFTCLSPCPYPLPCLEYFPFCSWEILWSGLPSMFASSVAWSPVLIPDWRSPVHCLSTSYTLSYAHFPFWGDH